VRGAVRGLDADEGIAGCACDLRGDVAPMLRELVARDDFVEESERERVGGGEHATGRHQEEGATATHDPAEALDATPCRHDAERNLVERALHVVGGDAHVARDRDLGAASVGVAVDRGEHRDRQGRQAIEHGSHGDGHRGRIGLAADGGQLLEVAAGDEDPIAGAGDHQHPSVRRRDLVEGIGQLDHRGPGDGVAGFGTVDGEDRHGAVVVEANPGAGDHGAREYQIWRFGPSPAQRLQAGQDS
jgi:hypothetical protein